jgi:ribosomal protein L20
VQVALGDGGGGWPDVGAVLALTGRDQGESVVFGVRRGGKAAGAYAFAHRKDKKTDMRRLFTTRLNAGLRALDITYSVFIGKLTKKNISINRKMLAEIAAENPETFERIVAQVK